MSTDVLRPLLSAIVKNIQELEEKLYGRPEINVAAVNRTTEEAIKALRRIRAAFGLAG